MDFEEGGQVKISDEEGGVTIYEIPNGPLFTVG